MNRQKVMNIYIYIYIYIYDFIKVFRSYSDMNTFPSGSQRHQLYPHNGRKTAGEGKGNGREIETRHGHSSRARLGLVLDLSQRARHLQSPAKMTPCQNPQQNGRGTEGIWLVTGAWRPGALVLHFGVT